ncbi:MAG TPA: hypothetical protein VFL88_03290 [Gemmatimonadales bacterium]|nr:hypothetical protein [Gemmatimonadales bacterium]
MSDREYVDTSGIPWTFVERKRVRREEAERFVVIMASSPFETRVIHCEREQWDPGTPDFAALLASSLPAGGSRGTHAEPEPQPGAPTEDFYFQ